MTGVSIRIIADTITPVLSRLKEGSDEPTPTMDIIGAYLTNETQRIDKNVLYCYHRR